MGRGTAIHWTSRQLTPTNRVFLAALPSRLRFQVAGRWVTIVHRTRRDPSFKYEYGDADPEDRLVQLLDEAEADILVMGAHPSTLCPHCRGAAGDPIPAASASPSTRTREPPAPSWTRPGCARRSCDWIMTTRPGSCAF